MFNFPRAAGPGLSGFRPVLSVMTHLPGEPSNNQHSPALSSLHSWIIKESNGELEAEGFLSSPSRSTQQLRITYLQSHGLLSYWFSDILHCCWPA